jgi:hypothetical protein
VPVAQGLRKHETNPTFAVEKDETQQRSGARGSLLLSGNREATEGRVRGVRRLVAICPPPPSGVVCARVWHRRPKSRPTAARPCGRTRSCAPARLGRDPRDPSPKQQRDQSRPDHKSTRTVKDVGAPSELRPSGGPAGGVFSFVCKQQSGQSGARSSVGEAWRRALAFVYQEPPVVRSAQFDDGRGHDHGLDAATATLGGRSATVSTSPASELAAISRGMCRFGLAIESVPRW